MRSEAERQRNLLLLMDGNSRSGFVEGERTDDLRWVSRTNFRYDREETGGGGVVTFETRFDDEGVGRNEDCFAGPGGGREGEDTS